ncbi:MAG: capsule assembly Wzi family protein [Gemmatimonas sp.]
MRLRRHAAVHPLPVASWARALRVALHASGGAALCMGVCVGVCVAYGASAAVLAAQSPSSGARPEMRNRIVDVGEITTIGNESDERRRLRETGDTTLSTRPLFRAFSLLSPVRTSYVTLLSPEVRVVRNSALPFSLNDGPMWAGRGANTQYTFGVDARFRMVRLVVAPQITYSENRRFQTIPGIIGPPDNRSEWSNPFHPSSSSIDWPLRFGDRALRTTTAGQSSLTVSAYHIDAGIGNENVWWGPGQQNAILLSSNAPGFAHAFIRTPNGISTRWGRVDAQWILGRLRESDFFDSNPANNVRSINGALVAFTPARFRGFNVGISRIVLNALTNGDMSFGNSIDFTRDVRHPNTNNSDIADTITKDQITSLFARLIVPAANLETYVEWARFETPYSLRDFLESPGHSQGYTVGLQWARPVRQLGTFRLAAEGTYLEPDASIRVRPVGTTYTSRSVVQGFTHRGQMLGAAIGPGSSSQWIGLDLFGQQFRVGGFLSRIRWDNATLWTPIVPQTKNEDVSLMAGLNGSLTYRGIRMALQYTQAARLDYLYQDRNDNLELGTHKGVDILNRTISITLSTAVGR